MPSVGDLLNVCGRHRFRVEIDGISPMGFREIEGVSANFEVEDVREGNDIASISRTAPGVVRYGPLVLRRHAVSGNTGNRDLWIWIRAVIDGEDNVKKNVSIVDMDRKGNDKLRFNLSGVWPSSWHLGKLESHSGEPLIEEMVLQYEALNMA